MFVGLAEVSVCDLLSGPDVGSSALVYLELIRVIDKGLMMYLKYAKLTSKAYDLKRATKESAGYDLCSAYYYIVPPKGKILVRTDIQISLPSGCYARIAPRSSLALEHFIDVGAGVVDGDYRGNVSILLFNFSEVEFEIAPGDRVAQLIIERIFLLDIKELSFLDESGRGEGGFGSSGRN